MPTISIKGWLGVIIVIAIVGIVVGWALGLGLVTGILATALFLFAPLLGVLVVIFLPLPPFVRVIVALIITMLVLILGLRYLGVV